jgi:hypothetical protein
VDLVLALETFEGLRHLPYLVPRGRALINRLAVPLGGNAGDVVAGAAAGDPRLVWLEGTRASREAGCPAGLNSYMLGALSPFVPVGEAAWSDALGEVLPGAALDLNRALFASGRRAGLGIAAGRGETENGGER